MKFPHTSRGCDILALQGTGGDGLFCCFAADLAASLKKAVKAEKERLLPLEGVARSQLGAETRQLHATVNMILLATSADPASKSHPTELVRRLQARMP